MKKSLLFNKITKYWFYFMAIYILAASLIIEGNIYFLLFNILGLCITIYLSSYYTYKETKNRSSSSKMLKIYSFIFIALVFLATSVFRGHHLSLNFKNWNSGNINLIPLTNTIADLKTIFIDKNYTNLNLLLGNIFLLVPLLYLYPRNIKNNNFFMFTLACFLTSFLLETFQFIFGVGQFDIDDIILNTMGPVIFYPLFNKGSISKIMDNIFYFKKEKITKNGYIVLGLASIFFLCLFYILNNDDIIKENKYPSLEIKALNKEEISFNLNNANIKLNSYKIIGYNDDIYYYYFIIPNKEGQTIIDFTLLNEENNGERHLKYQVTVNKDLSVSYEEIN